jgi:hypothetical protein
MRRQAPGPLGNAVMADLYLHGNIFHGIFFSNDTGPKRYFVRVL